MTIPSSQRAYAEMKPTSVSIGGHPAVDIVQSELTCEINRVESALQFLEDALSDHASRIAQVLAASHWANETGIAPPPCEVLDSPIAGRVQALRHTTERMLEAVRRMTDDVRC